MKYLRVSLLFVLLLFPSFAFSQAVMLRLGSSRSEINFREEPGMQSKVRFTVTRSNLLVILPRETREGFAEVFDIESHSFGYVYETLIDITDTLELGEQHFFEPSEPGDSGVVTAEIVNNTESKLFLWINRISYFIDPHERKTLELPDGNIVYFASSPGLYPVFGREALKKGSVYRWNFSL